VAAHARSVRRKIFDMLPCVMHHPTAWRPALPAAFLSAATSYAISGHLAFKRSGRYQFVLCSLDLRVLFICWTVAHWHLAA
jgi:hypothetical protein